MTAVICIISIPVGLELNRVIETNLIRVSCHCISYSTLTVIQNSCTLVTKHSASVIKVGVA